MHREGFSIFSLAPDIATNTNNFSDTSVLIVFDVLIMMAGVGFWHEHRDIPAEYLFGSVSKQIFGGFGELLDDPLAVDNNNGIDGRIHQR